jgi:hypothetical protein
MALAGDQLGVSEEVLRYYLANVDSVLLASFIHIIRPLFRSCLEDIPFPIWDLSNIIGPLSKFDI